jgi:ribosomal protein L44E
MSRAKKGMGAFPKLKFTDYNKARQKLKIMIKGSGKD